jgi:hypothetical protein
MARALRCRTFVMAYVIASTCIDVKDGACVPRRVHLRGRPDDVYPT